MMIRPYAMQAEIDNHRKMSRILFDEPSNLYMKDIREAFMNFSDNKNNAQEFTNFNQNVEVVEKVAEKSENPDEDENDGKEDEESPEDPKEEDSNEDLEESIDKPKKRMKKSDEDKDEENSDEKDEEACPDEPEA